MKLRLMLIGLALTLGLAPLVTSCSMMYAPMVAAARKPHLEISRGMSMAQVRQILGEPSYRRFNAQEEEWEYVRPYSRPNRVVVTFSAGAVSSLNSFDVPHEPEVQPVVVEREVVRPPVSPYPPYGYPYGRVVDNGWFEEFFRRVKEKPFTGDQLRLIASAPENKLFTSGQCLRLMSLFRWDDEKLKVLRTIAPRLADHQYAYKIIDDFTFDSGKNKAAELLGIGRTDRF